MNLTQEISGTLSDSRGQVQALQEFQFSWKTIRELLALLVALRDYKGGLGNPIGLSDIFRDSL